MIDSGLFRERKPSTLTRRAIRLIRGRIALHALVRLSLRLFAVLFGWILILLAIDTVLLSHLSLHFDTDVLTYREETARLAPTGPDQVRSTPTFWLIRLNR